MPIFTRTLDSTPSTSLVPPVSRRQREQAGRLLKWAEPLLLLIASPLLLFPAGELSWIALGAMAIGWLIGTWRSGIRSPLDHPLLVLFLMVVLSLYLSVEPSLSLPKFFGILLGFGAFYATVRTVNTRQQLVIATNVLVAAVPAVGIIALVATNWNSGKYPLFSPLVGWLPRLVESIPTSFGPRAGIHPNEIGGTLAFLLPVSFAMALTEQSGKLRAAYWLASLFGLGVLTLSGSRSAFVAAIVSCSLLLLWRHRRSAAVGFLAIGVAALVLFVSNAQLLSSLLLRLMDDALIQSRFELWGRTLPMIGDFPFTGIGLNTYPLVLEALYPSFTGIAESFIPLAHNIFLQTAVDLGLAGLLGLLGIAGFAVGGFVRVLRRQTQRGVTRDPLPAVIGMFVGVVSYLVFGLTDAMSLGAKPLVLLWVMIGLAVARERLVATEQESPTRPVHPGAAAALAVAPARPFRVAGRVYWAVAYALVGAGYLVAALARLG